jgi:hypothetical protein
MAATQKAAGTKQAHKGAVAGLRFPPWYDPNSPEVIERRRKLFAALEAGYSKEAEEAMDKLARESDLDEDMDDLK